MPDYNLISRNDWSLHRKGHIDQQRHREKVKEAIKNNLPDIIAEEGIILSNGKKIVKIPIRSLQEYRFRFNRDRNQHGGQGDGDSQVGEVLGTDGAGGSGSGKEKGAGDQPGVDYYEVEMTVEEISQILFEELALPNMKDKQSKQLEVELYYFNDIRKKGLSGNLDKKRTLLENFKRNAINGNPHIGGITPEDLRYKTWTVKRRYESNAVVLAMMDTSGSMGNFEKYIARNFFFWMVRFLRTKYMSVDIVFIAHHTQAKVVSEEEFFTKGESGGTKCSSAYKLALDLIESKYLPQEYNLYPFHFSDGDNLPSDNELCVQLVNKLLDHANLFGYGEIVNPYYRSSTLMNVYKNINRENFKTVSIKNKNEVYKALKSFFGPDSKEKTGR
ncbi:MAG: sporulation protein YhbH [Thermoanaerobacteraceae bacterium]|nr:sporulation protein YhbH [Thermoanaerobacteraceae bacterium]